jgi:hypothetical protein
MERHHLDLTREELVALGKHLDRGPLWTMSPRITVKHAIALKLEFHRALPPYELPELESPLWYAMMKIKKVSSWGFWHRSAHDMFWSMVNLGGSWISLDDPVNKDIGFAREDGSMRQAIYLCRYKETMHEWGMPEEFRRKMASFKTRPEVARILSSGDHCLEFDEDSVPWIVHRWSSNSRRGAVQW